MRASTEFSLAELSAAFYYDETSESCLRLRKDKPRGRKHTTVVHKAGDAVGHFHDATGYWVTRHKGVQLKCHRIVYAIVNKVELGTDDEVDHEDGDRSNNRASNLRLVGTTGNSRNRSMYENNSSGKTGVGFHVNKAGNTYAKVQWNDVSTGKRRTKYFSVDKYGLLPAFSAACFYRSAVVSYLNSEGAGYTERHGK